MPKSAERHRPLAARVETRESANARGYNYAWPASWRIEQLRKQAGLSQPELAERLGLGGGTSTEPEDAADHDDRFQ